MVGARVRAVLESQGRAQKWVAERLGISQPDISRRLRGVKGFTMAELVVIARELGVPLADLLPEQVPGDVGDLPASLVVLVGQVLSVRGVAGKIERRGLGS